MKRLFTCILLCVISTICFAQLNITNVKQSSNSPGIKKYPLYANCTLSYYPDDGFVITYDYPSGNIMPPFFLGKNKNEALKTLNDMIKLIEATDSIDYIEVKMNGIEYVIKVYEYLIIHKKGFENIIWPPDNYSSIGLNKKDLGEAQRWITAHF